MILFIGIEEVVIKMFEEKNNELKLLLPVAETENKPSKSNFLNDTRDTEQKAYFKADGVRRGYDIEV